MRRAQTSSAVCVCVCSKGRARCFAGGWSVCRQLSPSLCLQDREELRARPFLSCIPTFPPSSSSPSFLLRTAEPPHPLSSSSLSRSLTLNHSHTSQLLLSPASANNSSEEREDVHTEQTEDQNEDECVQCAGSSLLPSHTDPTDLCVPPASAPRAAEQWRHRRGPFPVPAGPRHPGPGRADPDPGHPSPRPLRRTTLPQRGLLLGAPDGWQARGHLGVHLHVQPGLHRTQL